MKAIRRPCGAPGALRERFGRRGIHAASPSLVAGEHVEQLRGVGDRARQHAIEHERRGAEIRCGGDAVTLRLQADQPAAGRGDAQRAAAVVAVGDRHHAGGDRRRGAAGGPARRARGIPGIASGAVHARLGDRQDPVLRELRRADDDEPRRAAGARRCGRRGDEVAHQRAALGQQQPRHRAVVLDRDRHTGERALVAGGDRVGGGERAVAVDLDEGAESRVERLDPRERLAHQLARRELAARTSAASSPGERNISSSLIVAERTGDAFA